MTRWILPPSSSPVLARHRGFLAQRAGGRRPVAPGTALERVLRRPQRMVLNRFGLALNASFALRHRKQLQAASTRARAPAASVHLHPTALRTVVRERGGERDRDHRVERHHESWRERVLRLTQQHHPLVRIERIVVQRTERHGAYPRVATALAQTAPVRDSAAVARKPANVTVSHGNEHEAVRTALRPAPAAWPLPPQELARLTASVSDQVISQLERRALSFRERSGRC